MDGDDRRREMRVGEKVRKEKGGIYKELSPSIERVDLGVGYVRGSIKALSVISCGEKRGIAIK